MPSSYSPNLRLELQATGENRSTWGIKANNDFSLIETAITGYVSIAMADANVTLTTANAATDQARNALLNFTGANTAIRTVTIPSVSKTYVVKNSTTGGFAINVKTSAGATFVVPSASTSTVYCDGTDTFSAVTPIGIGADNKMTLSAHAGNYTAVLADNNTYHTFSVAATLSLTAIATLGTNQWHMTMYAAGGDVTIDPNGAELINGAATLLVRQGMSCFIMAAATGFSAFLSGTDPILKWRSIGIGSNYYVDTSKTGVDIPPSSDPEVVFIELTAGLTGVGAFNNGKLTSESVTGSAPLVIATATISVAGSPMNSQVISLINTESRITRPSATAGTLLNDALQGHIHRTSIEQTAPSGAGGTGGSTGATNKDSGSPITDGSNGTPRTANETRMKSISVKSYMRIQ